jgi:hypothetical protein
MKKIRRTKSEEPLMFGNKTLIRSYSVFELAMIAAGCAGTPEDRVGEAVELLEAAERAALGGKDDKLVLETLRDAERDLKTGLLVRKSLLELVYQRCGLARKQETDGNGSGHADRLYREWCTKVAFDEARGLASEEIANRHNLPPVNARAFYVWSDDQFAEWEDLVPKKLTEAVANLRQQWETGAKTLLIHDNKAAEEIIRGFARFLRQRKEPAPRGKQSPIKCSDSGRIVSPKTRGSGRDPGSGTFKPKNS